MMVAVIPVRGGSRGLPGKNMRNLCGKPLLWHTVRAAQAASSVNEVVVSTDDLGIARYASSLGATVLLHPEELSGDTSPTYPVIRRAVEVLEQEGRSIDYVITLRATTPLRSSFDINSAMKQLILNGDRANSVVSVRQVVGVHPIRLKRVSSDGYLEDAFDCEGYYPVRRQSFETLYLRNGGIYGARREVIRDFGLWGMRCLAYVMPDERSVNINTEFDFIVAEAILKRAQHIGRT